MRSAFDDFSIETREFSIIGSFLTWKDKHGFINYLEPWMFSIYTASTLFDSIKHVYQASGGVSYSQVVLYITDNLSGGYKAEYETFIKKAIDAAFPLSKDDINIFKESAQLRLAKSETNKLIKETEEGNYSYDKFVEKLDSIRYGFHAIHENIKIFEPGSFLDKRLKILQKREEMKQVFFGYSSLDNLIPGGQRKKEISVIASRPSMGKCHRASTLVQTKRGDILISEIKVGDFVNSLTEDSLRLESKKVLNVINQGYQDLYRLKVKNLNYSIDSTANHPFLTIDGWKNLSDLTAGDTIAVPKFLLPPSQSGDYSINFSRLVGYLIGDGSLTKKSIGFTGAKNIINDIRSIINDLYPGQVKVYLKNTHEKYDQISLPKIIRSRLENPLTKDLNNLGLMGKNSFEKFIPNELLASKEHVRQLLIGLWDTDGSSEGYGTVSLRLAEDIQRLLLYFGIITQLHRKKTRWQNGESYSWRLRLTGFQSIIIFWNEIGRFLLSPLKRDQLFNKYNKSLGSTRSNILNFPYGVWNIIGEYINLKVLLKELLGRSKGNLKRMTNQGISYSRLERIIKLIESKGLDPINLKRLIKADVYWGEIDSIKSIGSDLTYDLEIEDNHNFVAEGFITHNSALKANLIKTQCELGFRVASISTEQTEEVETDRMDALLTSIPVAELAKTQDWNENDQRIQKIIDSNRYIDDHWNYYLYVRRDLSTEGVGNWLRRLSDKYGELDVCYIDLFDRLIDVSVSNITAGLISSKLNYLNLIAEELNIHICLIVQINRAALKEEKDNRPKLHHLKGSGGYEEVARLVSLLHRERYYNSRIMKDELEVNIAKQNNGPDGTGVVAKLDFNHETLEITEHSQAQPNIYE